MKKIFTIFFLAAAFSIKAQSVAINNTGTIADASSILDVANTTKGILVPRMTLVQKNAIATPANGLLVYQTDGSEIGFHYYDLPNVKWVYIATNGSSWSTTGNSGTNLATNFIGTTDAKPLRFRINNINAGFIDSLTTNTGFGFRALDSSSLTTSGQWNTAFGYKALGSNTSGIFNTAVGGNALAKVKTGDYNVAVGTGALRNKISGYGNTAIGTQTLFLDTFSNFNTAVGFIALQLNTSGADNTAVGALALNGNKKGNYNTAIGKESLTFDTVGNANTATGYGALYVNQGADNTATGYRTLNFNTTGYSNVAIGTQALLLNSVNSNLVAIGDSALYNNGFGAASVSEGEKNTAVGSKAFTNNTKGSSNTALGFQAGKENITGNYNTAVGNLANSANIIGNGNTSLGSSAYAYGSPNNYTSIGLGSGGFWSSSDNRIEIGNNSVASIAGNVAFSNLSDIRTKSNIQNDVPGLSFIKLLEPITYNLDLQKQEALRKKLNPKYELKDIGNWASKNDIEQIRFSGFSAQAVLAAAKTIGYNFSGVDVPKDGGILGIRYTEFIPSLTKAIQEQQSQIENQQQTITSLKQQQQTDKQTIDDLLKRLQKIEAMLNK